MKRFKSVLLYGWFGEENLGDELILKSTIETINKIDNEIKINVMGTKPKKISKNHKNINRVCTTIDKGLKNKIRLFKYGVLDTIKNIEKSDALILISGGALSDWNSESTRTLFYLANKFKEKNRPIIMLACGAGPIIKNESKTKFYNELKDFEFITVRDVTSYNELKQIGLKNIYLTNDIVFDYELKRLEKFDYLKRHKNKKLGIVISPLYMGKTRDEKYVKDLIEYIKKVKGKYDITLIPFQYSEDIEVMKYIAKVTEIQVFDKGKDDVWTIIDELKNQDLVLGLRLHCVIICLILGIPIIPIIYHHKVYEIAKKFELLGISEHIGDGKNWNKNDINVTQLIENTDKIFNDLDGFSENITNIVSTKLKTGENKKFLKNFLIVEKR